MRGIIIIIIPRGGVHCPFHWLGVGYDEPYKTIKNHKSHRGRFIIPLDGVSQHVTEVWKPMIEFILVAAGIGYGNGQEADLEGIMCEQGVNKV